MKGGIFRRLKALDEHESRQGRIMRQKNFHGQISAQFKNIMFFSVKYHFFVPNKIL